MRLIDIEGDDRAVSIARLAEKDDEADEGSATRRPRRPTNSMRAPACALSCLRRRLRPAAALTRAPAADDFFQACRILRHHGAARLATVNLQPPTDGVVQDFEHGRRVENVGRRAPARRQGRDGSMPGCGR